MSQGQNARVCVHSFAASKWERGTVTVCLLWIYTGRHWSSVWFLGFEDFFPCCRGKGSKEPLKALKPKQGCWGWWLVGTFLQGCSPGLHPSREGALGAEAVTHAKGSREMHTFFPMKIFKKHERDGPGGKYILTDV